MAELRKAAIVMGSHWQRQMGGAQFQAKCIVDALLDDGRWSVDYLASLTDPEFQPDRYRISNIGDNRRVSRYGGFLFDSPKLFRALHAIRPDIVYQRGLKSYTGVLAGWSRRNGTPLVFHIAHDDDVAHKSWRELLGHSPGKYVDKRVGEYGLRRATAIIAQTKRQAAALKSNFGISAAMIAPNFHPLPSESCVKVDGKIRVVWVANFKEVKRPELFVELASMFSEEQGINFTMIGRPGDPERYATLIERIDQMKNLEYLGEQPIEVVNDTLCKSHIFVSTSASEGFPNTFIQAWMRKVPVVSLDVNPDKVLSEHDIGVCCDSLNSMRNAIRRLAKDNELRNETGLRASKWANKIHGPMAARRITDFLYDLASVNSEPRLDAKP